MGSILSIHRLIFCSTSRPWHWRMSPKVNRCFWIHFWCFGSLRRPFFIGKIKCKSSEKNQCQLWSQTCETMLSIILGCASRDSHMSTKGAGWISVFKKKLILSMLTCTEYSGHTQYGHPYWVCRHTQYSRPILSIDLYSVWGRVFSIACTQYATDCTEYRVYREIPTPYHDRGVKTEMLRALVKSFQGLS